MANDVTHKLVFKGKEEDIREVLEFIQIDPENYDASTGLYNLTGIGTIDFNKIIPMPDHIFRGSVGAKEREKYGCDNWYDWSIANWGTKWNAYNHSHDLENNRIFFDTAWSAVPCLIKKLSGMFPDVVFELSYADEDYGYNTGIVHFHAGDYIYEEIMEGGSEEAMENAAKVLGYTLNDEDDEGVA